MFAIEFKIKQPISFFPYTQKEISYFVVDIVEGCNYKIIIRTDDIIKFERYGPMPVAKGEFDYYMRTGTFKFAEGDKGNILNFTYNISYLGAVIFIVFMSALQCIIAFGSFTFIGVILILVALQFLHQIYKIRQQAKEMVLAIVNSSNIK